MQGGSRAIISANIVYRGGLINGQKVVDIGKTHVILQGSQAEYALKPPWRQGRPHAQGAEAIAAIQKGFLFEHSAKVRQDGELIVFITPKMVKYDIKPEVAH